MRSLGEARPKKVHLILGFTLLIVIVVVWHQLLMADSRQSARNALSLVLIDEREFESRVFGEESLVFMFKRCEIGKIQYEGQQILGYPVIFSCNGRSRSPKFIIIVDSPARIMVRPDGLSP